MILKSHYKYEVYKYKFFYITLILYPYTRVLTFIDKIYNKIFLTRFNTSRA